MHDRVTKGEGPVDLSRITSSIKAAAQTSSPCALEQLQHAVSSITSSGLKPDLYCIDYLYSHCAVSECMCDTGHCSPRPAVRVPVPLLPRPTPHSHRPPQATTEHHCSTTQQPQRCNSHVTGAVAARTVPGRGPTATALQQPTGARTAQGKGRPVAKKGSHGSRALTLTNGHSANLQSR